MTTAAGVERLIRMSLAEIVTNLQRVRPVRA